MSITLPPLPRPGPLGLIQYAGSDMQEYAAAVSAAKDAEIAGLRAEMDLQPCGHPKALLVKSAETGEPLYCEACDDRSGRCDAEARETELAEANKALRERVRVLEDALRHVDDCLSINDYGDYVLLGRFDSEIVRAALEQKP